MTDALIQRARNTKRVQLRAGDRVVWEPSKSLRAMGFRQQSLGGLSVAALNTADELNVEADAQIARRDALKAAPKAQIRLAEIFGAYRASSQFAELAANTQRNYLHYLKIIEEDFGEELVGAIGKKAVRDWHDAYFKRSPADASYCIRVMRLTLNWAVTEELIPQNRIAKLRVKTPKRRRRIATRAELAALVAAADEMGRASIGDACILGVTTMQREADVLALHRAHVVNGVELMFVQSKTQREMHFDLHKAARKRLGALPAGHFVISEETGAAYQQRDFQKWFARVRAAAGAGLPSILGADPAVIDPNHVGLFVFEDFRRTGMVWSTLGGAGLTEVCSVSGHDLKSGLDILEVYIPRSRLMANRALEALDLDHDPAAPEARSWDHG